MSKDNRGQGHSTADKVQHLRDRTDEPMRRPEKKRSGVCMEPKDTGGEGQQLGSVVDQLDQSSLG